jgi:cobalamin biosynthesis Co2+ chelatase CbiK
MRKINNLNFLKNIIDSDFLILKKEKKIKILNSNKYSKYYKDYQILDLLETNRDLKQLVQTIKFIKKDITKEEVLVIMTEVIHKCRDQFKLSTTSINNIKSAK